MATVSATMNIWGNYKLKVGRTNELDTGNEFEALEWLSAKLEAGHALSKSSGLTMANVEAWRADQARVSKYLAKMRGERNA